MLSLQLSGLGYFYFHHALSFNSFSFFNLKCNFNLEKIIGGGFCIVEFEQKGEDRAEYEANLLIRLAKKIQIKGLTSQELSRCRQFYQAYPHIFGTASQDFKKLLPEKILGTVSQELKNIPPTEERHLELL